MYLSTSILILYDVSISDLISTKQSIILSMSLPLLLTNLSVSLSSLDTKATSLKLISNPSADVGNVEQIAKVENIIERTTLLTPLQLKKLTS